MRMARPMQRIECIFNIVINPGFVPARAFLGAGRDDIRKGFVSGDLETVLSHALCKRPGDMQCLQRQYRAPLRLDPESVGIIARIGHGEDTMRIGAQHQIKVNSQDGFFPNPARPAALK